MSYKLNPGGVAEMSSGSLEQQIADLQAALASQTKRVNDLEYTETRFGQDNIAQTVAQSVVPRPHCVVTTSVTLSVTNVLTTIPFDTDLYNPLVGMHDAVNDKTHLWAPVTGVYLASCFIDVPGVAAGANLSLQAIFTSSNTNLGGLNVVRNNRASADEMTLNVIVPVLLSAGDNIAFEMSTSGAGTNTSTNVWASLTQIQ